MWLISLLLVSATVTSRTHWSTENGIDGIVPAFDLCFILHMPQISKWNLWNCSFSLFLLLIAVFYHNCQWLSIVKAQSILKNQYCGILLTSTRKNKNVWYEFWNQYKELLKFFIKKVLTTILCEPGTWHQDFLWILTQVVVPELAYVVSPTYVNNWSQTWVLNVCAVTDASFWVQQAFLRALQRLGLLTLPRGVCVLGQYQLLQKSFVVWQHYTLKEKFTPFRAYLVPKE